jgi:hypothetical protein
MQPDTATTGALVTPLGETMIRMLYLAVAVIVVAFSIWSIRRARRR